jgi:stage II sporulation protein P
VKRRKIISSLIGLGFVILLSSWASTSAFAQPSLVRQQTERDDGGYYRIVDEQNNVIDYTARYLSEGDQFINADNMCYQIRSIEGDYAHAQLMGKEAEAKIDIPSKIPTLSSLIAREDVPSIGIYHTHSAECYVPSDGTESDESDGGIVKVGKAFEKKLDEMGFKVYHSDRLHHPHDVNAYYRSRRTAIDLLKKSPTALFDVHRDAVPPEVYYDNIDGHDVTKLKFVVGNTNPRFQTNLEFAKQLKAAADKKYPGIIQGILVISSDFNQDLAPRAMLIEAGAHTNEREHAEQGIAMFAETLPAVLGSPRASEAPPTPEESSGAWKAVILGIILVAAAVFGYLYMNTGSIEGATNQLRNFFSRIPLRRKD